MTTALVPLRDGVSGKSRLAAVLDAGARRRLVRVLGRHVVSTLLVADGIERVVVVTADPDFTRETLAGLAAEVLEQPADRPGLNGALEHAREVLVAGDGAAFRPGRSAGCSSTSTARPARVSRVKAGSAVTTTTRSIPSAASSVDTTCRASTRTRRRRDPASSTAASRDLPETPSRRGTTAVVTPVPGARGPGARGPVRRP